MHGTGLEGLHTGYSLKAPGGPQRVAWSYMGITKGM